MDDKPLDSSALDRVSLELDTAGLNLKQLYYFHAVATEGSIANAAKRLGVTQPTISEQIRNLETFLDTKLFDRRSDGMRVNHQGRRVYEHTKVMFRAARRLVQDINPARTQDRWILEIGLCTTVSRSFAATRFINLFRNGDLAPRIRHGSYDDLVDDLLSGEIDLVVSENAPTAPDSRKLGVRTLRESPVIAAAAPDLAKRVTSFPRDLGTVPFIHYTHGSRYRWELDSYFFERGICPEVLAEVDDVIMLSVAAEHGLCWVAVPETVVQEKLESGILVNLGEIDRISSAIYAQFTEVNTPDVVKKALDALSH